MPDPITLTDAAEGRTLGPVTLATVPPAPRMQNANLSVLAYAHGFTAWHYYHDGALRDVLATGYFDPACDLLTSGDLITVSALDGMAQIAVRKVERRVTTVLLSSAFFPPEAV